jgi:pimeloyl-ACP methyl ester carboxylesterase
MPRYSLCHPTPNTLTRVHGFPIVENAKLAYYSSHGNIMQESLDHIQMALIIIHGAGRNADDYYCSATAVVELQNQYPPHSVLIIVPQFPSVTDAPITLHDGGIPLQWADDNGWRYGAQAVYPRSASNVSSFDTIDRIVTLLEHKLNLKHVTIAGHSAGGQFVQRWSLLTTSWISNRMSSAVANPSNYAYLTPLRFLNGTWQTPKKHDCPQYNEWEFGLEDGGDETMTYKDNALKVLGNNITALMERFANRRVTYLAGGADRCNVSESNRDGWCFSHELETTCMDMLQGSTRWERNMHYVTSLRRLGIKTHQRRVVNGVGHDHSLIFTSTYGLEALVPSPEEGDNVPQGENTSED